MSLTAEQVQTIRSTVPVLEKYGTDITKHFYAILLGENPDLNNIFNRANQADGQQPEALAGALYAYASHIDNLGALTAAVEKMCQKHASLYVTPAQYKVVGEYLLRAMGDVLGSALTPTILEAWGAAYWQLANLMIDREETLRKAAGTWVNWRDFAIAKKIPESETITSFYLTPVDGKPLPEFLPGQYISVRISSPRSKYLQPRQYSLSDSPKPDYYRISVKKETGLRPSQPGIELHPGYVSNVLHEEKQAGDKISVSFPRGEFFLDVNSMAATGGGAIVLLSAGVGITPMISILNYLVEHKIPTPVTFVHGARSMPEKAFHEHVKQIASGHPNISSVSFIKSAGSGQGQAGKDFDVTGRVNIDQLDKEKHLHLSDQRAQYFVCGPEQFMRDVRNGLKSCGVGDERIKLELFGTGATP